MSSNISATSGSVTLNGSAPPSTTLTVSNKTGAYTVVAGDNGTVINCTSGTFTVSLTAAATLGAGFNVQIVNTGTGFIMLDPNASEKIDGAATCYLAPKTAVQLVCDGSNFITTASEKNFLWHENHNLSGTWGTSTYTPLASGLYAICGGAGARAGSNYSSAFGSDSSGSGATTATGAAATNIRTVATIRTSEVIYA